MVLQVVIVGVGLVSGGEKGGETMWGIVSCRIQEMKYTAVGDVAMMYVVVGVSIVGSVLWASAWVGERLNRAGER